MKQNNRNQLALGSLALFAMAVVQSQAASITVPNGSFETLYKPGSTTITAQIGSGPDGWTVGVGGVDGSGDKVPVSLDFDTPSALDAVAFYNEDPITTGSTVVVPGWIQSTGAGAISRQSPASPYGIGGYFFMANGMSWGNAQSGTIQSANTLALVASDESYTLSMFVIDPNTGEGGVFDGLSGRTLDLLADGAMLTPSSSTGTSGAINTWTEFTNTYDAASLAAVVGKPLTIRVGWAAGSTGSQSKLDNVTLTSVSAIPEPTSLSLLALGALGLVRRKRR